MKNKATIQEKENTAKINRCELIDTIIDLAGDEYESKEDYLQLAKMSDSELMQTLFDIEEYIKELEDDVKTDSITAIRRNVQ